MVGYKDGGGHSQPPKNEAATASNLQEIDKDLGINFSELLHNVPNLLHDPGGGETSDNLQNFNSSSIDNPFFGASRHVGPKLPKNFTIKILFWVLKVTKIFIFVH